MKNFAHSLLACALMALPAMALAQRIALPAAMPQVHPRIAAMAGNSQAEIRARLQSDVAAQAEVKRGEAELAPYLAHITQDPMWLASRLQMYWKTHATEIYNRGGVFDHVEGHAPVATVRYPGSRDPLTIYKAPEIADIPPYEDDTKGVFVVNGSLPEQPLEWASAAKCGRIVDGINSRILHLAAQAAKLYWITGNERYARLAQPVLDTYLRGMYYRRVPIDLDHGHSQTIYGLSTFEVIQEGILRDVADAYDFLHDYLKAGDASAMPIYADAMRRWIDVTVRNGVPFNNWDLLEARLITAVALVLDDDTAYADGSGRQHYLNSVLNDDVTRQWSLKKLAARGFDAKTGIWFESPGYSMNVVHDFITLLNDLDAALGTDLLLDFPVIPKAVLATGQYLYPNGYTASFGDAHHTLLASAAAREMVKNAQRHHRREQEVQFTGMVKLLEANAVAQGHSESANPSHGLDLLFAVEPEHLDASITPMKLSELMSPTFSAPSVSYFVQRNGFDPEDGLMAVEAGSLGNHQHANGIELELYGRGMVLAPESGIGSNYFEADHAEYYSQFPASNTVVVDGVSSYPTMKSQHGFTLISAYPSVDAPAPLYSSATFSDVSFHEPETDSDQRRVVSLIRTSATNGYYVDIFRSRRRDGTDKFHDYFFHGIGQEMAVTDAEQKPLALAPTEELTFANEELPAYDYFWDKRSIRTAQDVRVRFGLTTPKKRAQMNLWMAGSPDRQIFAVKAPASHAVGDFLPHDIAALPMPTLVARQSGEAWNHPFVVVFEPTDVEHTEFLSSVSRFSPNGAPIDFVGLDVRSRDGSRQRIFSAPVISAEIVEDGIAFQGTFGVAGESGAERYLVLGSGRSIARDGIRLEFSDDKGGGELDYGGARWSVSTDEPCVLIVPVSQVGGSGTLEVTQPGSGAVKLTARKIQQDGRPARAFDLPILQQAQLAWP